MNCLFSLFTYICGYKNKLGCYSVFYAVKLIQNLPELHYFPNIQSLSCTTVILRRFMLTNSNAYKFLNLFTNFNKLNRIFRVSQLVAQTIQVFLPNGCF